MNSKDVRKVAYVRERSIFGKQWLENARRSHLEGDVFSAFFAAYVALVCSATQLVADHSKSRQIMKRTDDSWERITIENAFQIKAKQIVDFVDSRSGQSITNSLRLREIQGEGKSRIIGTGGDAEFKEVVRQLCDYWEPLRSTPRCEDFEMEHAKACSYLFRRVRNRLFHGEKLNDPNGSDADLLEKLNPLLFSVVEIMLAH